MDVVPGSVEYLTSISMIEKSVLPYFEGQVRYFRKLFTWMSFRLCHILVDQDMEMHNTGHRPT